MILLLVTYGVIFAHDQQAADSRRWVDHTREVIDSLDRGSRGLDQMEVDQRLIRLDRSGELFERDRRQALALEAGGLTLQRLIADNAIQVPRALDYLKCATQMRGATATEEKFLAVSAESFAVCHQTLVLMRDEETSLMRSRSDEAQADNERTVWEGIVGAVLTFAGMIGLFWFLIRSAVQRRRLEQHLNNANHGLSAMVKQLEVQAEDLQLLALVRDELQLCSSLKEVQDSVAMFLSRLMPTSSGALCLINESRNQVERVASWGTAVPDEGVSEVFHVEDCCALRAGRVRWHYVLGSEVQCGHFTGSQPLYYACLPLSAQGEALGFVTVRCVDEASLRGLDHGTDSLRQIVELAAMTIASIKLRIKLQNQSIRDGMTGLYNRSFMEIAFDREIRRASRKHTTLAVFMLDVDHFKAFNDGLGHAAGDMALNGVAEVFRSCVRAEDIICRYGGEEFAIILPDISEEVALVRAESIRQSVSEIRLCIRGESTPKVTISIGVAMFPANGDTPEALLRAADQALYRAKREGRNRVLRAMGPEIFAQA